jgi:Ala-tRNA(Pro) deacylase
MVIRGPIVAEKSMRVCQQLAEQQVPFETLVHPPAFTAQRRAKYLHVPGRQVAKGVLLKGPAGYFLAVVPATRQVDMQALAVYLGGPVVLANRDEVAMVFTDCEWGVTAPFGSRYGLPVYLDESLAAVGSLVLEHHSHFEAIRMSSRDFEELEHARRLQFAR